jgi:hypothetical protein
MELLAGVKRPISHAVFLLFRRNRSNQKQR